MKHNMIRRKASGAKQMLIAAAALLVAAMPVYASTQRETVTSVKLTVRCDPKPEVGKEAGTVTVTQQDGRISITESAAYYDMDDAVWLRGETPSIRVELSLNDTARYRFTSATKVTVSGFQSEVSSKKVLGGGDSLQVNIRLPKVTGPLGDIEEYYWEENTAHWSDAGDADRYEVRLYRGNSLVQTISTNRNEFDFYPYMTRAGEYSFRVRGLSSSDEQKSPWTERSEENAITAGNIYTGPSPSAPVSPQSPRQPEGWQQDNRGWSYRQTDGSLVRGRWLYTDNNWFHLADDSYMDTGWIYVDNNWFYLNPVSDGTRGAMKVGWQHVDNNWFYLNPVSDGTRGAMKTGWQYLNNNWYYLNPVSDGTRGAMKTGYQSIDGRWFYLDPSSGVLWVNRAVPNGSVAGSDGVLLN